MVFKVLYITSEKYKKRRAVKIFWSFESENYYEWKKTK